MQLRSYRKWPLPAMPFLLGRWPRSQTQLIQAYRWPHCAFNSCGGMRFGRPAHRHNLHRFYRWAGLPFVKPAALSRLASHAFSARHKNSYHNAHHVMQVMLLAALFSYQARCCRADRQMLVLAALAHDLGHQGRRASTAPSASEAASAWRACQLYFRRGADGAARNHLTRLVIATSSKPNISRSDQPILSHQTSPSLAALLSDADLFPSHNYGRKTQLWLAAKVKFEQRSPLPVETILSNFLAKTRLQSRTARGLVITN